MQANETRSTYLRQARRNPQEPSDRVAALVVTGLRVLAALALLAVMLVSAAKVAVV